MPNTQSVAHFLLVDLVRVVTCYLLLVVSCDGGETKSTPSPTDLGYNVRLDWSLTKMLILRAVFKYNRLYCL